MNDFSDIETEQEIENPTKCRPHFLLLGAGATRASIPDGDRYGQHSPLMPELASMLNLIELFPDELKELASSNFELAFSQMSARDDNESTTEIEFRIAEYFGRFRIPDSPTLFDYMNLCLRDKDVIATFNWDPLLIQSQVRLRNAGVDSLPRLQFLHGNVSSGYCLADRVQGIAGRAGVRANPCSKCGKPFTLSRLLYPVEVKNYANDPFIAQQWSEVQLQLRACMMFTIFGYGAPSTDVEAVKLLKDGWGEVSRRMMEQVEIIDRPGASEGELRRRWEPFIHTHHVDIFDSFFESWIPNHPRRTVEAHRYQYFDGLLVNYNPVPRDCSSLGQLIDWFGPLLEAEKRHPELNFTEDQLV